MFAHRTHLWSALLLALAACNRAAPRDAGLDAAAPRDAAREAAPPDVAPADAAPPDAPRANRIVLTGVGDVLLHRKVEQMAEQHRTEGGLAWQLAWFASLITPREVAMMQLNSPLSSHFRPPGSGSPPVTGGNPAHARALARVGVDGVCLANARSYDQTADGLWETMEALRGAHVGVAGAGATEEAAYTPWVTEREGVRVAYLCATERTSYGPGQNAHDLRVARFEEDGSALLEAVRASRALADVVVVGVWWNREPFGRPSVEQRRRAAALVEAGADLVLGSGSPVVGPVERARSPRGDAVIAWSLGNSLSSYGVMYPLRAPPGPGVDRAAWDPATRDSVLLRVQFELLEGGSLRLATLTATGLWTLNNEFEVRTVPLRALDERLRAARQTALTAALGDAVRLRQ